MTDEMLTLIGLTLASPSHSPFWTRAVPVGRFSAITLNEGKRPDQATLMAICRACTLAMPDFVPVAPTRISQLELAEYVADQQEELQELILRVGGRQETILTLSWKEPSRSPSLPVVEEGDWQHRCDVQLCEEMIRQEELAALAHRLAAPAEPLTQASTFYAFDGGCDLSLLHAPSDQSALVQRIETLTCMQAPALSAVTAELSGPFPPYSFVHLPPYDLNARCNSPA